MDFISKNHRSLSFIVYCCNHITHTKNKMKYFQTIQRLYRLMGISSSQQNNQNASFNVGNFGFLLLMVCSLIQSTGFLLYGAKSVSEYGTSCYASVTLLGIISSYTLLILKRKKTFTVIENFDTFIETSRWKCIFIKANWRNEEIFKSKFNFKGFVSANQRSVFNKTHDRIEQISQFFYSVLMKFSYPANMLPPLAITLTNYFVLNLGDDSFFLPFPTMYEERIKTSQHWF